jgi:hypothetical protein
MKFLLGLIVGAFASRPAFIALDKQFGKQLRPRIAEATYKLSQKIEK